MEVRRAKELLDTALPQQQAYSYSWERIHSTPHPSWSYIRHWDEPAVSSSERRRHRHRQDNPAGAEAHAQEAINRARHIAREDTRQTTPVHPTTAEMGVTASSFGVQCLIPALRSVKLSKDFKGPRKVPNYSADLAPEA